MNTTQAQNWRQRACIFGLLSLFINASTFSLSTIDAEAQASQIWRSNSQSRQ